MKWLLPLLVLALSGCVEAPVVDASAPVDQAEASPACEPRQVLGTVLEHRGLEEREMENEGFQVDGACRQVTVHVTSESTWVGDMELHVESPSGVRHYLMLGAAAHQPHVGHVNGGYWASDVIVDAEPGLWLVRAKGTGSFEFHVQGFQA